MFKQDCEKNRFSAQMDKTPVNEYKFNNQNVVPQFQTMQFQKIFEV